MKHKTKKALSLLLSLALALGLLPGMSLTAYAAEKSETISLIGEMLSMEQTATGEHFKVTAGYGGIDDFGLTVNKFGAMTIESLNSETITKVELSYAWDSNANTVSASPGTINDAHNIVSGINATKVTISSSSPAGVRFNSVKIYYSSADVAVTGVTLNKESTTLTVGGTETLTATVAPDDATDKSVTWSSDNTSVATVEGGVVTAVAAGTANITVTTTDGSKTATCAVTVNSPHTHSFSYSASGATITATCSADGCPLTNKQATLTISASDATYDGNAHGATLDSTAWTGAGLTVPTIQYSGREGTTYTESATAPTNAGKYTAKITVEGQTASVDYEIAKATPTATAPSATATYGQTLANVTLTNPSGNTAGAWSWVDDGTTSVGNAGSKTFKANFTPTDTANYDAVSNVDVTVTVNKIDATDAMKAATTSIAARSGQTATVSYTLPDGASYGTVTNSNTDFFSVDTTSGIVLTAAKDWTVTDWATDATKTFNVAVNSATNYNDYTLTVTVTPTYKQEQTITAADVTATYGDTGKSVSATTTGDGTLSYAVTSGDAVTVDAESGALTIVKAGTATVTVTASETSTYAQATKDVTVTINKAALTVKAKDQSIYVNGTLPALTSADSYTVTGLVGTDTLTTPPTLAYQKDGSAATPDTTTTGTYDIVPSGAAADNYTISYENGTLTISRRPSSGPSTPPTTTVTVPVSGDDESVSVTVRVSGDTATITTADVDKVLDAEDVGTVTIDVSTLKADVTEVVIPGAMVDKIADAVADEENNADGLEIKLPSGTVTFDADAVAAIAEQANGKDLRLNLEDIGESKLNTAQKSAVDDMNVQEVLDVYMTSGGQRISDFKGGKAVVEVSYTLKDGQTGRGVIVWYVADDGTKTEVPTTYNDEAVSFTVEHFSNYVIAYDEERAAACPRDDTCPMSAFSDLDKTKWYHDALHYALENKIMVGVGDGKFNPNGTMSRAMFATILYRIAGEPEVTGENTFTDVEAGRWYTDAVIWAAGEKIIEGYGNNIFGTNDPVTREQMAAIFWRYQGRPAAENADLSAFSDTGKISTWAQDAFEWAVSTGIISGKGGGILDPKGDATRAEVAQIVMNYDLKVK